MNERPMPRRWPDAERAVVRAAGLLQRRCAAVLAFALWVAGAAAAQAQGQPQGQEDFPGRVGRVADVAGELFIAPQDKPDAWMPAGQNYPVASGDNLWLGGEGRAEVDFGGGQFRFAADTSVHVSQLDERHLSLFVAQGRVSVRVRALQPGDVATIDTPNAQVAITRPGLYRFEVTDDREHTVVIVREGEVNVQTQAAIQQVLPGQAAYIDGADPQYANVQNGIGLDGFDSWVASRDSLYRTRGNNYVSPQMVGAADLDRYGTWQQMPEYGAVWYPSDVPADWAPYRNGYWVDVGAWGPTWVDFAPWGYAPFHYGRWAFVGGRWGWCPGAYTPRPLWAPALVAWTGGAGWSLSVSTGGPVYGWVPLAWGEPFRPWWGRCSSGCWDRFNRPFAVNVAVIKPWSPPPRHWRNASAPGGITAVPFQSFQSRQPVAQHIVRVPRDVVATAPMLASPPVVRHDASRVTVQRPATAPPPASTLQATMVRPMQGAPGGSAIQRSNATPEGNQNRSRPGMPGPAGASPGATQGPAATGNVVRSAPVGSPGAAGPSVSPSTTAARPGTMPAASTPPMHREARPGMTPPQAVPGQQPSMRVQSQGAPAAPQAIGRPPQAAPAPSVPQHVQESRAQPAVRSPQVQPSQGQPTLRAQPMQVPQAQPAMRSQPPQAAQAQPIMRSQPAQVPQAQQPMRQPQMTSPQAVPQQPAGRPQAQHAAPPHASPSAPAPRAMPQPAPDSARQGPDSGNITRGERSR